MQFLHRVSTHISLILAVFAVSFFGLFAAPFSADARTRPDDAPQIANWYIKWSIDSDAEAEWLAEWDMMIIDIESGFYSRDRLEYIKELNPDIKIMAYISPADLLPDARDLDEGTTRKEIGEKLDETPQWILRKENGEYAHWWQDYYIYNITNKAPVDEDGLRFNTYLPRLIRDKVIKDDIWDGVFYDNLWEDVTFVSEDLDLDMDGTAESKKVLNKQWRRGIKKILQKTRKYANNNGRKDFIIMGNGGTRYHQHLTGVGYEHFPNTVYGGWVDSMEQYNFILSTETNTELAFLNSNVSNSGNAANYKKFRFGMMSALLNDGYFHFDNGDLSHTERWYYDEYDISIGDPINGAFNTLDSDNPTELKEGVWRRDYEDATVLLNSTNEYQRVRLGSGYERFQGSQDTDTNSGQRVGSITIPPQDGILLLRTLQTIPDAVFVNGAFTKVFGWKGKEKRNSFFAYDGRFEGQEQVHRISKNGKVVVAGDTYVEVYNNKNDLLARFAPYGSDYTGGVNIAVSNLYGGGKNYIVTGNKSGQAHVRIYDLKGNIVNDGCYPFPPQHLGGVNVGVGNVQGGKSQEIVVAAGFGGGPHVRIFSNNCTLLHPGFFAYEEHLRIGVNMAVGDVNGDGRAEIITGAGPGGGPHVRIFNNDGTLMSPGFFAYDKSDRSGVLVSTADTNGDGKDEIITSSFGIFDF